MKELIFEKCFVKAFTRKIGGNKSKLTFVADLTPKLAGDLGVHSIVMDQKNVPKQGYKEVDLAVLVQGAILTLEVPAIAEWLHVPHCEALDAFVARRKGSTKAGKPSELRVEFKATWTGAAVGVFEWLEKYGGAAGDLKVQLTSEQMDFFALPKKSGKNKKATPIRTAREEAREDRSSVQ